MNIIKTGIPRAYVSKEFNDPFEEDKDTLNITVIEFEKILYYSKRTAASRLQPFQAYIRVHNFLMFNSTQVHEQLTTIEYFDLLLTKPQSVQEKANYQVSEQVVGGSSLLDLANTLGIMKDEANTLVKEMNLSVFVRDGYKEDK